MESWLRANWRYYAHALLIFFTSRIVVVVAVNFGTLLPFDPIGKWQTGDAWFYRLARWDTGWYAGIISSGYGLSDDPTVNSSVNFFPLYPLASSLLKAMIGHSDVLSLLLVANVSSVILAIVIAHFFRRELGETAALMGMCFLFFYPSTIFLSAGYSESLCLVFVAFSLSLMAQRSFGGSALASGLATAARSTSVALVPALLYEMLASKHEKLRPRLLKIALCAFLSVSGLLLYATFLGFKFGHPLAFVQSQDAWHSQGLVDRVVAAASLAPLLGGSAPWEKIEFLFFLAISLYNFYSLRFSIAIYGLAAVLECYFLDGVSSSTSRYLLMCIPAFMGAAAICERRPWLVPPSTAVLASLLFRKAALFSQWYWEG